MRAWKLQKVKLRLSPLIRVYERLMGKRHNQNIVSFFRSSPLCGMDLDLTRDKR
jgi:hypothetical protein